MTEVSEAARPDVGIDIGMNRLAWGWPYWGQADSIDLGSNPGMSRDAVLRHLQSWLAARLPVGVRLWVDQAYAQHSVATAQRLTETISAVMTAREWEHPVTVVHQATWKSQVLGNARADKAEIAQWLHDHDQRLWSRCATEDEYDAAVIGYYGVGRTEGRILAPEPKKRPRRKRTP